MENLAVVLSGGAGRGGFHLGVLHFLEESNIEIKAYSGTSIGAIIAVSHASGVCAKEQMKIFSSKEAKQSVKFNFFKKGLLKINPDNKIINHLLPIKNLEHIKKEVFVNAYDIKEKKLHYFKSGNALNLCLASSALIPLFKPIKYENMQLIDGGYFDNLPISPLENKNYNILGVDLMPKKQRALKKPTLIRKIKAKIFEQRIKNLKYSLNHFDYYLTNSQLHHINMYSFKYINESFNLGYKTAQKAFK